LGRCRLLSISPRGGLPDWGCLLCWKLLLQHAVDAGVAFVPGSAFTIDQQPDAKARLSYSTLTPDLLGEAVRRLTSAVSVLDRTS
jgi:2-aminoadipate transaminase